MLVVKKTQNKNKANKPEQTIPILHALDSTPLPAQVSPDGQVLVLSCVGEAWPGIRPVSHTAEQAPYSLH